MSEKRAGYSVQREEGARFEEWCIVEVMGHHMYAGLVSEQEIGGSAFIRLDVPEIDEEHPPFTKFFNHAAIYALTPTTEDFARRMISGLRQMPIDRFRLPEPSHPADSRSNSNGPDDDTDDYDYDHDEYGPYMSDDGQPTPF